MEKLLKIDNFLDEVIVDEQDCYKINYPHVQSNFDLMRNIQKNNNLFGWPEMLIHELSWEP